MTDDKTVEADRRAAVEEYPHRNVYLEGGAYLAEERSRTVLREAFVKGAQHARAAIEAHEAAKGEGITVESINRALDIDLWQVPSFRADVRIDFREDGSVIGVKFTDAPDPSESEREALAKLLCEADAPELGYERRYPDGDTDEVVEPGEEWRYYLPMADRMAAGFRRHPAPATVVVETALVPMSEIERLEREWEAETPTHWAETHITVESAIEAARDAILGDLKALTPAPSTAVSAVVDMCRHTIAESEAHDKSEAHRPCETHSRAQFARRVLAGLPVAEDGA